jgi:hypothetical protein
MSVRVMQAVWQHSKQSGGALVLLLAIADNAHDDGGGAYPSIDTLARKARMTGRNVNILLKALVADGEIAVDPGAGPHGVNVYRVLLPGLVTPENISPLKTFHPEKSDAGGVKKSAGGGEKIGTGGVKPVSPKPSLEPSNKPSREEPSETDVQFARFWSVYPKRKKRQECLAWFKRERPDPLLVDAMIASVERSCLSGDWQKEGGRYIPLPDTWLRGRRWEDEDDVTLPSGAPRLDLVGKDKERYEVMRRVAARRGFTLDGTDASVGPDSRAVSRDPLRLGDGRLSR